MDLREEEDEANGVANAGNDNIIIVADEDLTPETDETPLGGDSDEDVIGGMGHTPFGGPVQQKQDDGIDDIENKMINNKEQENQMIVNDINDINIVTAGGPDDYDENINNMNMNDEGTDDEGSNDDDIAPEDDLIIGDDDDDGITIIDDAAAMERKKKKQQEEFGQILQDDAFAQDMVMDDIVSEMNAFSGDENPSSDDDELMAGIDTQQ